MAERARTGPSTPSHEAVLLRIIGELASSRPINPTTSQSLTQAFGSREVGVLSDGISAAPLIVLLISTAALAKGECKVERKKFCAGMVKKELWDCLSKHEAELGAPCKTKIEARAKLRKSGQRRREIRPPNRLHQAAPQAPTIHHLQRTPSRSQAILTARRSRPGRLRSALFLTCRRIAKAVFRQRLRRDGSTTPPMCSAASQHTTAMTS